MPFALALPQDRTERILLDAVKATGLVDVRFGSTLQDVTPGIDSVRVHSRTARGTDRVEAAYLVGCDGAASTTREQFVGQLEGKTYPTHAMLADVRVDPSRRKTQFWPGVMGRGGWVAAIQFAEDRWRIIDTDIADEKEAMSDDYIYRRVDDLFEPGPTEIVWRNFYRKHERCAKTFRTDRILLAGDAAHLNSPAGGQGMNSGVQDAHNLAWKLAAVISDETVDVERLLDSYDQERRGHVLNRIQPLTGRLERLETAPSSVRYQFSRTATGLETNDLTEQVHRA